MKYSSRSNWRRGVRKLRLAKHSGRAKHVLPEQFKRTKRVKNRLGARS